MLNPKLFHVGKVKIITFKLSDFFIASSRLSKNLISYFRIKNRHKLAVFYQSQHMCQLMIIVRRHISCHFLFQEFKSLAILTTYNDNFSDTTIVIFRVLRHISCHFIKNGFSRINDCSY